MVLVQPGDVNEDQFGPEIRKLWGAQDIEAAFPEGRPMSSVPWRPAGRMKHRPMYDQELVSRTLSEPPELEDVDPRGLRATQPQVTRAGVSYYFNDDQYRRTGETYADKENVGNQYPVVYTRPSNANPEITEDLLLSGHHRGVAALLRGERLQARRIRGS